MPFKKLLSCKDAQQPLVWWEQALGRDFPAVRPFLIPCTGKCASSYPCPDDPAVCMAVHESGGVYRAVPTGEHADDFEDVLLQWDDVQLYGLRPYCLAELIRDWFDVEKRFFQPLENLHLVGYCPVGDRSVYASLQTDSAKNLAVAAGLHSPETAGCVIFPERVPTIEPLMQSRGVSTVFLDEACSGDSVCCGQACGVCGQDITNAELQAHVDRRLDTLGYEFSSMKEENEQLKVQLAQLIANIAKQVEPEYFKWIYMILASGSVNKASQALKMANSTFDKRLKEYASRGGMYKTLYDLIAVRRGCGIKSIEGYNPAFSTHQDAAVDDPGVIKDLLSALENLNADNWPQVRDELIELVREELM